MTNQCDICGKLFSNVSNVNLHLREQHNVNLATLRCAICGQLFLRKFNLKRHLRNVHRVEESDITMEKRKVIDAGIYHDSKRRRYDSVPSSEYEDISSDEDEQIFRETIPPESEPDIGQLLDSLSVNTDDVPQESDLFNLCDILDKEEERSSHNDTNIVVDLNNNNDPTESDRDEENQEDNNNDLTESDCNEEYQEGNNNDPTESDCDEEYQEGNNNDLIESDCDEENQEVESNFNPAEPDCDPAEIIHIDSEEEDVCDEELYRRCDTNDENSDSDCARSDESPEIQRSTICLQMTRTTRRYKDGYTECDRDTRVILSRDLNPEDIDFKNVAMDILNEVPRHFAKRNAKYTYYDV